MFKNQADFERIVSRLNIDTEPNPAHRENLRRQMLSVFNETAQKRTTLLGVFRRSIMKSPITKLAAAAVIIIGVLISIHYLGGSINMTCAAYAEVVERLHNARTLTYTVKSNSGVEYMPSITMEIAFKEPGYMRMSTPDGYVSIIDSIQGKGLTILPPKKQFIEMEISNLQNDPAQQNINVIEKLRSLPERADEQLGTREVDGREVQGFRITEEGLINTVWIDMQTRELVLVEMEFLNAPAMNGTMRNFQFDVELDDSLFNLSPPDGYARLDIQVDTDEVSEENLIEFLKLWTTDVKDSSFPPTLDPTKLAEYSMEMVKRGDFVNEGQISEQEQLEKSLKMTSGLMFLLKMSPDSNWRYAGENIKFGDAGTAIFWYRPEGSETYRVIYGDLSVRDVAQDNLPKQTTETTRLVALDIKLPTPMFRGTPQDTRVDNLEKPLGKARPPFLAPVGTKNVAFEKPVSSSDEEPIIGEIELITDGDKEAADGSYVELGPFLQHVTIDLEAEHNIYAIVIWHYHKQATVYFDVVVQVTDDPDFITNVRTLFNNDIDNSAGFGLGKDMHYTETNEGKLIDAKGVRARYIRLYSNGNTGNDLNHYIEVEVYGTPAK